jgi:monothiol glutaredoxin
MRPGETVSKGFISRRRHAGLPVSVHNPPLSMEFSRMTRDVQQEIHAQVSGHAVVLYMKGTPQFPQCGFSATAADILKRCGVRDFLAVNVLPDTELRDGLKAYAHWPTLPQLYVRGEFIGGCDIMREMASSGELQALLAGLTD